MPAIDGKKLLEVWNQIRSIWSKLNIDQKARVQDFLHRGKLLEKTRSISTELVKHVPSSRELVAGLAGALASEGITEAYDLLFSDEEDRGSREGDALTIQQGTGVSTPRLSGAERYVAVMRLSGAILGHGVKHSDAAIRKLRRDMSIFMSTSEEELEQLLSVRRLVNETDRRS